MKATVYCGNKETVDVKVDGASDNDLKGITTMYSQVFSRDCNVVDGVIRHTVNSDDRVDVIQTIVGLLTLYGCDVKLKLGEAM